MENGCAATCRKPVPISSYHAERLCTVNDVDEFKRRFLRNALLDRRKGRVISVSAVHPKNQSAGSDDDPTESNGGASTNNCVRRAAPGDKKSLRLQLEFLWEELKVPRLDREHSLLQMTRSREEDIAKHSARQVVILLKHRGATLRVLSAIDRREEKLELFMRWLTSFQHRLTGKEELAPVTTNTSFKNRTSAWAAEFQEARRQLRALVVASVDVFSRIDSWRQNLWRPMPFLWRGGVFLNYCSSSDGHSYLEKMSCDCPVLLNTPVSRLALVALRVSRNTIPLLLLTVSKPATSCRATPQRYSSLPTVRVVPHRVLHRSKVFEPGKKGGKVNNSKGSGRNMLKDTKTRNLHKEASGDQGLGWLGRGPLLLRASHKVGCGGSGGPRVDGTAGMVVPVISPLLLQQQRECARKLRLEGLLQELRRKEHHDNVNRGVFIPFFKGMDEG